MDKFTIKELREKNKMSQSALAKVLGISSSSVGMYEQNRRKPDDTVIEKLCSIFNVDKSQITNINSAKGIGTNEGRSKKNQNTDKNSSMSKSKMNSEGKENMNDCEMLKIFGKNVFSHEVMQGYMSKETYEEFLSVLSLGEELSFELATKIAKAMKQWAIEKGATHYSHWFQPLTGSTAEKQDSFLERKGDEILVDFSGKTLIKGETDASSFPSGGLRATFEARGYTTWDCTSPVFIREDLGGQKTLVIPTAFCSFNGMALDKKTPLLRSMEVINKEAVRLLHILGYNDVNLVKPMVGGEQEYFLVSEDLFKKRRDLKYAGRTLFGSNPPKGQELGDQYYATISERVSEFMSEVNNELWKMGVLAKTQHNEAAPAQYELALLYDTANVAVDHNQLAMEVLKKVARRHGLVCLFHEKPFDNINGSGKHNNWSLATDKGENLLKPSKRPFEDLRFMMFFTGVISAVHKYANSLRASCATLGNELRIGGYEAPPAIISVSTGEFLEDILKRIIMDEEIKDKQGRIFEIGVSTISHFTADKTDRNRTSPFAFTGDKFEFRLVGSSQSLSTPNTVLNSIVAGVLGEMSDYLENSNNVEEDARKLIKEMLKEHFPVIYNGNNYSDEWVEEAKKRGLPHIDNGVDAILELGSEKMIKLFEKTKVYNKEEIMSRVAINLEKYAKSVNIEALAMIGMTNGKFIPAPIKYITMLSGNINSVQSTGLETDLSVQNDLLVKCNKYLQNMSQSCKLLSKSIDLMNEICDDTDKAIYARDNVIPIMRKLRKNVDKLESMVDVELWPVPTFSKLLFYI